MKLLYQLTMVVIAVAFLASCNNNTVYEKYQAVSDNGWNKDSLVVFNVQVDDTAQTHNLWVNIRNKVDYNYSNIWLFIEIVQPGGKAVKDTFELVLSKPSGEWLGEGFGKMRTHQVMFRRNIYFPVKGVYQVKIQQGMREENLKGISDVGITVGKAGS